MSGSTRWMYPFERRNRLNHNDEGDIDPLFPPISIFNQNGRGSKKRGKRSFTDMEMQLAVTHILLNCPEIQSYVNFPLVVNQDEGSLGDQQWSSSAGHIQGVGSGRDSSIGPESQVLTMNKYCVNGFKFQTEEVSRNTKTNNSGFYIQGDVDDTGQTIEYYGVIQEIIEVRYSEISENEENESFDDEEWDDNENETTEEEEWENDGIETSEEE
ncbi:hypothetical protein MTR67_027300 [Solanum verrucosum]|uniref:Uncharacterized protein n=1 Tax=Solanum verrucosum TaxID=315347 RepID=A0AAF0R762_SOLVR|nr:hypothetical protein MTR67_027300 [Solanum verrucosum]